MSESETSTQGAPPAASPPADSSPPPSPQGDGGVTSPSPSDISKPDSTSPSSSDSRQSDRDGLLAAVRAAVPEKKPEPDTTEGQDDAGGQDREAASGDGQDDAGDKKPAAAETATDEKPDLNAADPTEAELKQYRPATRKRIEALLAQRNEARTELERVAPELKQHRELQGYLTEHQLAPDDMNALLHVGAALRRGDYQGFLDGVAPYVIASQEALGLRIAADLHQQVTDGTLSEDAAREMTRTRHRAAQAEHRLKEQGQQHQQESQQRSVADIRAAVDTWEANIRARDPDYALKAHVVRRYSQALLNERGIPTTVQDAVALTQAAYDEATAEFNRMRPPPQPTRRTPSSVHASATNGSGAAPPPSTMLEAAKAAHRAYQAGLRRA